MRALALCAILLIARTRRPGRIRDPPAFSNASLKGSYSVLMTNWIAKI